jgi:hypothetical protein
LLGRHVRDGSDDQPLRCHELRLTEDRRGRRGLRHQTLGQSEIQDLDHASVDQEQIGRLDVAMQNAITMRGVEGISDLDADVDQFGKL